MVLQPPVQGLVGNILSEGKNGLSHLENTILKYETSISKGITVLPFTKPASFPVGHHFWLLSHFSLDWNQNEEFGQVQHTGVWPEGGVAAGQVSGV